MEEELIQSLIQFAKENKFELILPEDMHPEKDIETIVINIKHKNIYFD